VRDSGGIARVCDMEPGTVFRERRNRYPLTWVGIDPVTPGKVKVLTAEGVSWVCNKAETFPLMTRQ
jgi:hypothetical protein